MKKKEEREKRVLGPADSRAQFCLLWNSAVYAFACIPRTSSGLGLTFLSSSLPLVSSSRTHDAWICVLISLFCFGDPVTKG